MKDNKYYKRLNWLQQQIKVISKKYHTATEIITEILKLTASPEWQHIAGTEAQRMVKEIAISNAETWRIAAKHSRQGAVINQVLKEEILTNQRFQQLMLRNEALIKSMPNVVAKHMVSQINTLTANGERVDTVLKTLAPDISENVARLVIRTETAKTQAAITQIRSEQAGLDLYIWRTVKDQRVRSSHKHMEGVICSYKNPPSPEGLDGKESIGNYNPGEIWNCRCYAEPIINIDFIKAPYKLATIGGIKRISKKELLRLS